MKDWTAIISGSSTKLKTSNFRGDILDIKNQQCGAYQQELNPYYLKESLFLLFQYKLNCPYWD